jgi:tetratricopeptide (TPR) repeat protein
MIRAFVFLLAALAHLAACSRLAAAQDALDGKSAGAAADSGVEAYRRADWNMARETWNLGNCAWREGRAAQAGAWYELALLHDPRLPALRANLELVRSRLGLPPAERGDLRGAFELLLGSLRASEWRLVGSSLFLLGAVAWILASPSRRRWALPAALAAFVACCACLAAAWSRSRAAEPALGWIVLERAAELRSEPRVEAAIVADAQPLERVRVVDALPGWIKVRGVDQQVGWLSDQGVFRAPR